MKLLNRAALVVSACEPMAQWLATILPDEAPTLAELQAEGRVYLLDEFDEQPELSAVIEANWRAIFENELSVWDEFGDEWPELNPALFATWFSCELKELVFDLATAPLMRADLADL